MTGLDHLLADIQALEDLDHIRQSGAQGNRDPGHQAVGSDGEDKRLPTFDEYRVGGNGQGLVPFLKDHRNGGGHTRTENFLGVVDQGHDADGPGGRVEFGFDDVDHAGQL